MKYSLSGTNLQTSFIVEQDRRPDRNSELKYLEQFKGYLYGILQSGRDLYPEEIKHIFTEQNKNEIQFQNQNLEIKAELYYYRIKILQKIAQNQDNVNSIHRSNAQKDLLAISTGVFKLLFREGIELKDAMEKRFMKSEKLNEVLFWIENLSKRIEDKFREISSISSVEALERIPRIVFGFIDLSQNLNEAKSLLMNKNQSFLHNSQISKYQESKLRISRCQEIFPQQKLERPTSNAYHRENELRRPLNLAEDQTQQKETNSDYELSPIIRNDSSKNYLRSMENSPFDVQISKHEIQRTNKGLNEISAPNSHMISEEKSKRSFAMVTIRKIIQNNSSDVSFDNITAVDLAQKIVDDFPFLDKSTEELEKFCQFLELLIIKYPNVYRELALKGFPAKFVSEIMEKSSNELDELEKIHSNDLVIRRAEIATASRGSHSNEIPDKRIIKKKIKKEYQSKNINLIKESASNPLRQLQQTNILGSSRVENLLKAFGIEESKLLNNLKVNEDLLRSKLIHSKSTQGEEFEDQNSPLIERNNQENKSKLRTPSENKLNVVHQCETKDEEECFSKSYQDDCLRRFGSGAKETYNVSSNKPSDSGHNTNKKKHKTPILYDPDDEDQPKLSDLKSNNFETNKEKDNATPAADYVLQIFDGMLQGLDYYSAPKIGLFTCYSLLETVKLIPKIVTKKDRCLRFKGSAVCSKIEAYINKAINSIKTKQQHIIAGWVESYIPICQDVCEEMASDLLFSNKAGVFKYVDCVKIFFLHEKQFRPEWIQRFQFTKKKLQKNSYSSLYFLLIFQPYKFSSNLSLLKRIQPEIVIPYRENKIIKNHQKSDEDNFHSKTSPEDYERHLSERCSIDISPISELYSPDLNPNTPRSMPNTISKDKGAYVISKYTS